MTNTLGKHLLIDFYNCRLVISEPEELRPSIEKAFAQADVKLEGISFFNQLMK